MSTADSSPATPPAVNPANRLGLDYALEAERFGALPTGIIDAHTHINGPAAAALYRRACDLYDVRRLYSMTSIEKLDAVRDVLGDRVRFIAVPNYMGKDRQYHHGAGYLQRIRDFHAAGVRIVKFWAAPRGLDYGREAGEPDLLRLDSSWRIKGMDLATELGMMIMVHVGDPDTWFATKYADASIYGTKAEQYEPLERLLDRYPQPWLAAHMGGWPEDLTFLAGLLERHENLHLDTSAVKWMVRELSRQDAGELRSFLERFAGRILFGSDIVAADEHLDQGGDEKHELLGRANSEREAFDLYASRYWSMRTLFETDYDGESPIADPDLALVEPDRYGEMDAPPLRGKSLPAPVLQSLYHDAADALLEPLYAG